MSINNLEFTSYNFLSNLATINADEVNTDVLTKSDPDITDLQFDMLEGINTNETIQQQIDNVTVDITGLEADVATLQSEMNTAQDDINTLQSEMNDAQADIGALYGISSANSAAIAGLSVSQAAQDVIISTHTGQIATLQGDVNDLEDRVDDLEVKTTDQSWGSLTGTTFSTKVNVGGAVTLNTGSASTFDDGLSASAAITSSAGTSQFSSLLVNTAAEVTNDLTITDGEIYIRRNTLTASKKLILYDNTTGNDYDYLGFWTDSGAAGKKFLNAEIDGVAGSAFQWYAGDGAGTSRTLLKQVTSANEIGYTPLATFLKTSGFSQQIQMVKDAPNNIVRIDMLGDTAGVNAFDGQIIQAEGNGVDDNRGTMTIQSGGLAINALNTGLNVQATTSTLIQSGTTTTLTSGGETEINSTTLDINATGIISLDSTADINLTATDIKLTSTGTGAGELVVRANTNIDMKTTTGRIDIDSDQGIGLIAGTATTLTSATTTTLTSTGETEINSAALDINATGAITVDTTNSITLTSTGTTQISSSMLDIDTSADITMDAVGYIDIISNDAILIQSAITTTITAATDINLNATDITLTTTGTNLGKINLVASTDVTINPTTQFLTEINTVDKLTITSTTTTLANTTFNINANTAVNVDNTFNMMPTATIIQNVSATVPSGFLLCNGQAVSRTVTYARLFAAIGTTFGVGNGTTTFNVPNFLGAFLRGSGTQTVGGVAYAGAAVGTAQQDAVLNPLYASNEGYFNTTSGGATRECVSRNRITSDPVDTNTGILPRFDRTATENRPFNFTVYYYIRY